MEDKQNQETEDQLVHPEPQEDVSVRTTEEHQQIPVDGMQVHAEPQTPEAEPTPVVSVEPKKKWSFRPELIFIPPLRRHLGSKARPLSVVVLVVVLVALGGASYWRFVDYHKKPVIESSFKLPAVAFKLVSTLPANKATDVNTSTKLVLNFSKPVTPAKLINNMFLTPKVAGTYKQGSNPEQVIFTPSTPFSEGSKVNVMINGTYESNSGSQLGAAYDYNFTTSIPSDGVEFQDQSYLIDQVTSLASGQKESYSLLVGHDVGSGASVTLYKGNVNDMLSSLVYTQVTGQLPSFNDLAVSTGSLTKVSSVSNITNNQAYNVQEPDGLYVAVATNSSGKEVGLVWVDFSSFGVLLRQDDQKVVMDAQQFSDSSDVPAAVSFYNLKNNVSLLAKKTVDGLTTQNLNYNPSVDLAVASYNNETTVVPINVPNSGGDIRVDQNLSTAQAAYGVTDRPTYKVGDTIQYAGYVRNDNDAQYTNPSYGTVNLYVAEYKGGPSVASFTASVDANGMFSGSIPTDTSWLASGDNTDQLQIFVAAADGDSSNDLPLAGFVLTNQTNATNNITVKFSKSSYLPSNQISATITATDASGKPLANQTMQVHTFAQDYYENDPAANLENFGYVGTELPGSPATVQLNSSGQATYTVNASSLPADGNSQTVTIQANVPNQTSGVGAAGGDSAIVHQGNAVLTFGLNRQTIPAGGSLVSDVYATDLSGKSLISTTISYTLVDDANSSTLTTGTATTDSNGMTAITIPAAQLSKDAMKLIVTATDSSGNKVSATNYYSVASSSNDAYDDSGAGLYDLSVSGSNGNVKVGDTVNLTINAPSAIHAMVTMDRGRIYSPQMVTLNQGNNNFSFTVGQELAPSFTLTLNYFANGVYHSEGVAFNVDDSAQKANVGVTAPSQLGANTSTSLKIATTDNSGNPLGTSLIVDVVSANAYNLSSAVSPNIFNALYNPRPIMTSSSSSLSPVGSGGGRCGGGGGDLPSYTNPDGTTLYWQSGISTGSSGQATVSFKPPAGSWIVTVYAMSGNTQVGSASTTITAN